MTRRTAYATCTLCEATCGLEVESEGRRITRLRGDERDPFSAGHVCPKAIGLRDLQEDPDRLRRPLRRIESGRRIDSGSEDSGFEAIALIFSGVVGLMAATVIHFSEQLVGVLDVNIRSFKEADAAAEWLTTRYNCAVDEYELQDVLDEVIAFTSD